MKPLASTLTVAIMLFACIVFSAVTAYAESDLDETIISNNTITNPTETPLQSTPTSYTTPAPTQKITPGSPLSLGDSTFAETIAQFDIMNLAKLVVISLGIMWAVIILVSVVKSFGKKGSEKQ